VDPLASGGTFTFKSSLSGVNFTTGFVITGFEKISDALRPLSVGFTLTTRTNLHTSMQTNYEFAPPPEKSIVVRDTSAGTVGRIAVPFSYGVGLGFQAGDRWSLAADFGAQPWAGADFNGSTPYGIRNSFRFGIGAERAGSTELTAHTFERYSYRFGFAYDATYYDVNGQQINEWGVTGGVGIPLAGESRLNLAAVYGRRGTTAGSLVKDKIFRLTVSLHISDVLPWFVQSEEE
jgi:hypothetical protein